MPPRKKNAYQLMCNFSHFEWSLLKYMSEATNRRMIAVLREALRNYTARDPRFYPEAYLKFVKRRSYLRSSALGRSKI